MRDRVSQPSFIITLLVTGSLHFYLQSEERTQVPPAPLQIVQDVLPFDRRQIACRNSINDAFNFSVRNLRNQIGRLDHRTTILSRAARHAKSLALGGQGFAAPTVPPYFPRTDWDSPSPIGPISVHSSGVSTRSNHAEQRSSWALEKRRRLMETNRVEIEQITWGRSQVYRRLTHNAHDFASTSSRSPAR